MLIFTALIWGLAFSVQRNTSSVLDAVSFNSMRFMLASATLIPVILLVDFIQKKRGKKSVGWNKSTIIGGVMCGFIIFCGNNLQQLGITTTTAGKASFITALYVVIVPLISVLMRKKTAVTGWFAVVIAIAGFWLMCVTDDFKVTEGDLLVLLCAFMFSFHICITGFYAEDSDPFRFTFLQFLTAAVLSVPAMAINGFPSAETIRSCILPLLYIGILSSALGFTLQTLGQQRTDPSTSTLLMSLESVFGLFFGIILLHEEASVKELIGCVLIFLAVILAEQTPHYIFLQASHMKQSVFAKRFFSN